MGFPSIFKSGGGGERGSAYYALTPSGKMALDNRNLADENEEEVMKALDFKGQASAAEIAKQADIKSGTIQPIIQSLKGRRLIMKVN
jgi:DNA-binding PadR family transcriptional regulator